jgi:hypothetical protein
MYLIIVVLVAFQSAGLPARRVAQRCNRMYNTRMIVKSKCVYRKVNLC